MISSSEDNQSKAHDKKEKKMVFQKPQGTVEYTVSAIGVAGVTTGALRCKHAAFPWLTLPLTRVSLNAHHNVLS